MICENILFLACPPKNLRDVIIIHPIGSFHVFLKARVLKQYCKKQNPTGFDVTKGIAASARLLS